eukprot:CAMPEP_0201520310 /NCGR_PEP_ID=MMETSP0161_2-20130828/10636_1 /ASSEMBLY_ACC=CAM_ASM_000251 /TAXON_ID=180227 /ORGANISM="Neoparamoeba aestuarina, Strain SoJaBio B1-5/56/2" /LENGTH=74 /DNA_ID=CAMNT_0047918629 /DNA_START=243 /DNA_END=467 /DNA_ORIENTATION=+
MTMKTKKKTKKDKVVHFAVNTSYKGPLILAPKLLAPSHNQDSLCQGLTRSSNSIGTSLEENLEDTQAIPQEVPE